MNNGYNFFTKNVVKQIENPIYVHNDKNKDVEKH